MYLKKSKVVTSHCGLRKEGCESIHFNGEGKREKSGLGGSQPLEASILGRARERKRGNDTVYPTEGVILKDWAARQSTKKESRNVSQCRKGGVNSRANGQRLKKRCLCGKSGTWNGVVSKGRSSPYPGFSTNVTDRIKGKATNAGEQNDRRVKNGGKMMSFNS